MNALKPIQKNMTESSVANTPKALSWSLLDFKTNIVIAFSQWSKAKPVSAELVINLQDNSLLLKTLGKNSAVTTSTLESCDPDTLKRILNFKSFPIMEVGKANIEYLVSVVAFP